VISHLVHSAPELIVGAGTVGRIETAIGDQRRKPRNAVAEHPPGPVVRQAVVLVLVGEEGEFDDGHEHGDELGTDTNSLVPCVTPICEWHGGCF
jgi:hypothetical protein